VSSNHASYFWPQLFVSDVSSSSSGQIKVDNVGHIAGLGARMDRDYRGPYKSPAGLLHQLSALDVERASNGAELVDDSGSNTLADSFINTIRIKGSPSGPTVWGLRTRATDPRYRQINVSRTVLAVQMNLEFIMERFVMEPIVNSIFPKVKGEVDAWMATQFANGWFYGDKPGKNAKPQSAWFAVCDKSNNPDIKVGAGVLTVDVSFVPAPNAERIDLNLYVTAPGFVQQAQ
jgi:phage tail sheath protein FI